jgi:hypothetical protein
MLGSRAARPLQTAHCFDLLHNLNLNEFMFCGWRAAIWVLFFVPGPKTLSHCPRRQEAPRRNILWHVVLATRTLTAQFENAAIHCSLLPCRAGCGDRIVRATRTRSVGAVVCCKHRASPAGRPRPPVTRVSLGIWTRAAGACRGLPKSNEEHHLGGQGGHPRGPKILKAKALMIFYFFAFGAGREAACQGG